MSKIIEVITKRKSILLYIVFGALTTIVNWATYYICFTIIGIVNVVSTIIAWIISVAFSFITNKLWVFDSKSFEKKLLIHEALIFLGTRIGTGLMDVGIMYIAVDVIGWDATLWKLISNAIVIIINYITSKLIIFKTR